jgi:hypothetical protein
MAVAIALGATSMTDIALLAHHAPVLAHRAAPPPAGNIRTGYHCRKPAQHDQ